jgi:hypothetical protein
MTVLAPIVLFVYNRPEHARRTVEALKNNTLAQESDLIVYSDAPRVQTHVRRVSEVRNYVRQIEGFKSVSVIERKTNLGLARSVIDGVTEIVEKYGRVIVLEDDMVTSRYFLTYMNDALEYYENEDSVISIHGYCYPIDGLPETFFLKVADCWGWGTWKRGWDLFESDGCKLLEQLEQKELLNRFDLFGAYDYSKMLRDQIEGKNSSWAIRWYASALLADKLTLYPAQSLVSNIGSDGSGTHFGIGDCMDVILCDRPIKIGNAEVSENMFALKQWQHFLGRAANPGWFGRIKSKIRQKLMQLRNLIQKRQS